MTKNLSKALKQQKKKTQQIFEEIYGTLGIPLGGQKIVEVPNRNSYVYVKLRDNPNEVIQAFNNKVAQSYGLPVTIYREGNRYIIQGVNTQRYENNWFNSSPYLPKHGTSHSFPYGGGGDVTWVFPRQIMMSLVYPDSVTGTGVRIFNYPLLADNNDWKYTGGTGTINLLNYLPVSGSASLMALVYLDSSTGNPGLLVNSGTYFPYSSTGSVYPYIPSPNSPSQIPLAGIRLSSGMSSVEWDNIYDVRQWIHSNASSSPFVQDEGGPLGLASTFNFVGDGVSVTVSGTVARIFISGSSGSGGVNTGTLDARYLKLDTSNDPLTGKLRIISTGTDAGVLYGESRGDITTTDFEQYGNATGGNINSPVMFLYRAPIGTGVSNFQTPLLEIQQSRGSSGTITGGLLHFQSDGQERVVINPSIQGTGTLVLFDGDFQLSYNGLLLLLKNNNSSRFYVNASGTAYSNGEPLIKEAPVTTGSYGRNNAGWILIRVPQSYYAHLLGQQIGATGTMFGTPSLDGLQASSFSILFTRPCTLKNFYFRNSSPNQPASGSLVLTILKNLVATSLVITVPAGSGVANYTDLVNTVSVIAGDFITVRIVNNATSSSTGCGTFTFDAEFTIGN